MDKRGRAFFKDLRENLRYCTPHRRLVHVATFEDCEKIRASDKVKDLGFAVTDMKKAKPRVVIRGVPSERSDEEVVADLMARVGKAKMSF